MLKKILIDCERTKYPHTGLYHFCLNLGNALLSQADPQQEALSFYLPPSQKKMFGDKVLHLLQHPLHKLYLPGSSDFDVWHSTHQDVVYRPRSKKVKQLLTVHDLNFLIERKYEPAKIRKRLQSIQRNIDRADAITCISAFTKQMMLEQLNLQNKSVEVIYNGCNIHEFPGFEEPVYKPRAPFIFALGTVLPKKNFHVLPCLLKNNHYELVIGGVGHASYEAMILKEAEKHGVVDRVVLTGALSEADKYWYYKNCLAFAFPSLAEGFGFPLVEAMYYGKPCFASALTSLPEIGGELVYYFNDFDPAAMQTVFENGLQHYTTFHPGAAIRERALQFSWTSAAKAYLNTYRRL